MRGRGGGEAEADSMLEETVGLKSFSTMVQTFAQNQFPHVVCPQTLPRKRSEIALAPEHLLSRSPREILLPPETGVGLQGRSKLVQEKEGSLREEMASLCSQNRVPIPGNCGHSSSTLFPQLPSPDPSTNPHTSSLAPVPGPAACQEPECTLGASAGSRHHREGVCGSHSGTILGDNRADLGAEN